LRLARSCIAVASFALVFDAFAQNPPAAPGGALPQNPAQAAAAAPRIPTQPSVRPAPPEDEEVQLKLPDADIDTVLSALEIYTGRIILRPSSLQIPPNTTFNLKITRSIPKAEAILAIETVLALNNVGIAPLGDTFLKVIELQRVKQEAPEMIFGSALDLPASGQVATKLFQLEFARVPELLPLFSGILNPFYGGPVPLPNANAVLITDSISNLQRIELLLQQIDKPVTAGMKPKFYTVRNVKASELVNKLRTILTGTLQTQLGTATTYNADDRTQQIVVVTDPRQWDFFGELIDRLDQKSDPNTRNEVLYLKHAKAEDVVNVLGRIISGQTTALSKQNTGSVRPGQPGAQQPRPPQAPGTPQQPGQPNLASASAANNPNLDVTGAGANEFSALMTVVNDERSNSVVVFGTSDDIRLVKELVDKLDIVLAQVRIEVVIAEVTLDDNHESGISALGLKLDGDKLVGFSGFYGDALSITNGTIVRPGVSGRMDLAAEIAIGTTPRTRNNSIVTVPAIVTSHGKQAKVFSGESRPVVTGILQSPGGVGGISQSSQVTQLEIGTTLTVTPFIGIDGSVQLDLVQSVQDVTGEVQVDQNTQYIIGKRETTNYVTAKSGEIIVLGGFRKDANVKEQNRLGPIPILGDIFGPRKRSKNRNELIFFLRPTVLQNDPAIDNAEPLKQIEQWPTRDALKEHIYRTQPQPPPPSNQSLLDKILPR
jgi:general secretion pathway protein D